MVTNRAKKVLRLHYWGSSVKDEPTITWLDNPGELRIGVGGKSFFSLKEDQITISGGTPSVINIQGLSNSMKYAGMIQDLPFPLSMMPTTPFTPFPKQIIVPPLLDMMDIMSQAAALASSLIGV